MADQIQKWQDELVAVEACIPGCRDKVRRANAELFRAKKKRRQRVNNFLRAAGASGETTT